MKVLFIAPVDNYDAKDSGYGNSAAGIANVLKRMTEDEYIEKLHNYSYYTMEVHQKAS